MGQWLVRMAQISQEIVSYLVRNLLRQVICLLHLLYYEMLGQWLRLLFQSTAQTEDTRRGRRARKQRRQSPVMVELLPATSERALTPSESAMRERTLSPRLSPVPRSTALSISTRPRNKWAEEQKRRCQLLAKGILVFSSKR